MPQIFKFGGYIIFFWSNENKPTEPIHVHVVKHNPRANSTKIWITGKHWFAIIIPRYHQ